MGAPLRAFLMLREMDGTWDVSVFHDLEGLVRAWEQRASLDASAIVHVGFERSPTRHFDGVAAQFAGQVLLTAGAKYTLPAAYESTSASVAACEAGPLFLATQGWGYDASGYQPAQPTEAVAATPKFEGWIPSFIVANPESEPHLVAAGIHDETTYLAREARLPRALRLSVGVYRFHNLVRNIQEPRDIATAAPPWLRDRSFAILPLTARLSKLFINMEVETVADLDDYSLADLLRTPNFGKKSVNDLIKILMEALNAGPLDREGALAAVEEIGLMNAVRRSLLSYGPRERDVLARRMGLDGPPQTLQEIGEVYGVTRERIRQIESKTLQRLLALELWDDLLTRKIRHLLVNREYPLPLLGVEAVDPWFSGVGDRTEVVRYLLQEIPEAGAALVEIDGIEYLALITHSRWEATLTEAKTLLAGGVGRGWLEDDCRQLVEGLLPATAQEFRRLLWNEASRLCHFVEEGGQRYLTQYGRGAEQIVEAVLQESDRPLHFSAIAVKASSRAGRPIEERRAHAAAASVGLLFGRGIYGLPRHLSLSVGQMEKLAEGVEDIVADGAPDRQWHTSELLAALAERGESLPSIDKYITDIALRATANLQSYGRMVWGQKGSGDAEAARIDIRQAILATLQQAERPLKAGEIRQRLVAARGLGQNFQIVQADPLIRVGPGVWGLNDRDVEVKRPQQPALAQNLLELLNLRQTGIHLSELRALLDTPTSMSAEAIFALATLDQRMRVNVGQYLFLASWGDARRMTVQEAVRATLSERTGFTSFEALADDVRRKVGRSCERTAISGSLQALGAEFDGRGGWRSASSVELEDDDEVTSDSDEVDFLEAS